MNQHRCSFAIQIPDLVPDGPRGRPPFGLCVHTSGRSIVARAVRRKEDVLEHAVAHYDSEKYSAHYVGGYDGDLVQITADDRVVPHIGVDSKLERPLYLDGRWLTDKRLSATAVKLWQKTWARTSWWTIDESMSPQHLYPSTQPNWDYVGLELPPLLKPTSEGLWYTDAQHDLVAKLWIDLAKRHSWAGWMDTVTRGRLPHNRLLGHEDLDAFERWDRGGGWDPGALRAAPRFDWDRVAARLVTLV